MEKIIIIICLVFLISCKDNNKKVSKYPNGNIKTETAFNSNNLKEGESVGYYENGTVKWKSIYINDTLNGINLYYYPNGKLKYKANFKKGLQDGVFFEYFENGRIKQKSYYKMGLENGDFLFYYHNGNLSMRAFKKNDTTRYYTKYDSLGTEIDRKHYITLQILSPLTTRDSIKIKEIIPGFVATNEISLFIIIMKYNKTFEGSYSKMKFNIKDSSYYYTFPPQMNTGQYVIETTFFSNNKFQNRLDTLITIAPAPVLTDL